MSAYQHTGTCSVGEPCPRCYEFGGRMEQERIIKLLEVKLSQEMSESAGYIMTENNYPVRWADLIALIKGEK